MANWRLILQLLVLAADSIHALALAVEIAADHHSYDLRRIPFWPTFRHLLILHLLQLCSSFSTVLYEPRRIWCLFVVANVWLWWARIGNILNLFGSGGSAAEQVSLSTRSRIEGRLIHRTPSGVIPSPRIGRHVRLFEVHISEWKLAPAPTSCSPQIKTFGRVDILHFSAVYGTCKSHKVFAQRFSSCTVYERRIRRNMYSWYVYARFGTLSVIQHRKTMYCQPLWMLPFFLGNFGIDFATSNKYIRHIQD